MSVLSLLALGSCGGSAPGGSTGPGCFPPEAADYIVPAGDRPLVAAADPGGAYALYLDGSASMAGYIRASSAQEAVLRDLIKTLPTLSGLAPDSVAKVTRWRFDREFTQLDAAGWDAMLAEQTYRCGPQGRCQDSHINEVLDVVAKESSTSLSVVVSDLWLKNDEVLASGAATYARAVDRIFDSGRSVAVYGFELPYDGKVADLPSGRRDITASRRYLFMLVAGPPERLAAFHAAMQNHPSTAVSAVMAADRRFHHALFTPMPLQRPAKGVQTLAIAPSTGPVGGAALVARPVLTARSGVDIPQFELDRSQAVRASGGGIVWAGIDAKAAFRPGAVWKGENRGTVRVWKQLAEACQSTDWAANSVRPGAWRADPADGVTLSPATLAALGTGTFLLVGTVERRAPAVPNHDTQWLRDWSFDAAGEADAMQQPVTRTLNLAATARVLELALKRSVEQALKRSAETASAAPGNRREAVTSPVQASDALANPIGGFALVVRNK